MSRSAFTALLLSCVLLALSMPARADDLPYRFGRARRTSPAKPPKSA